MRRILGLVILLAGALAALAAPPSEWRSTGIGGGGALFAPCFSPHQPNELYVSCDMSDLFHTTSLGQSWTTIPYQRIQVGRLSPKLGFTSDPKVVFMVDSTEEKKTLVQSTDGGATWKPLANEPIEREVWGLAVDPTRTDRLLIADYSTLYFSNDGGRSFAKKHAVKRGDPLLLAGAFFDEQFIAVGTNVGLLVSNDGDDVRAARRRHPRGRGHGRLCGWQVGRPDAHGLHHLPHVEHLFRHPGGRSHQLQGHLRPRLEQVELGEKECWTTPGTTPFFVVMAANNADTIYVGGGSAAGVPSICKTTSGGDLWQSVFLTQNNQNIITGWSGYRGDRDWPYSEFLFGLAVHPADTNRMACSDYGFVHMTTDGGKLWRQAYVNPAEQNPAGKPTPKGRTYRGNGLENTSSFYVTWLDPKTLWGSFADIRGIRSTDGGTGWSFDYKGHTANSSYQLVIHPNTQTAYMAASSVHDLYESSDLRDAKTDKGQGDVLFSTDKGKSWQPLGKIGMPVISLALDPNNPRRLYGGVVNSQKGGIYLCPDITRGTGAQWQRLTAPPRTEGHPNTIHALKDGTLVCTHSGRRAPNFTPSSGVFLTTDGGATWQDRSDPNMHWWTRDLIIDPHDPAQNTWYVGVFSGWGGMANGKGGLYKTTDRGKSWTKILDQDRVASCTVHPKKPNELYVTTEMNGLWLTENANTATPRFTVVESFPFRQPQRVFFNPHKAGEIWVTTYGNGLRVGMER